MAILRVMPWLPLDRVNAAADGLAGEALEVNLETKRGYRDFEVSLARTLDDRGNSVGVSVTLIDVTDLKLHVVEITRLNRLLAMLSAVNRMGGRMTDWQQTAEEVCRICVDVGEFNLAVVRMIGPDDSGLKVAAHCGRNGSYLEWATTQIDAARDDAGPSRTAIRTGEYWVTKDVATARRWRIGVRRLWPAASGHSGPSRSGSRVRWWAVWCCTRTQSGSLSRTSFASSMRWPVMSPSFWRPLGVKRTARDLRNNASSLPSFL
ncbi:MAG: hypothetical protein WCP21_04655, partial [Armatimonadota bacterium]